MGRLGLAYPRTLVGRVAVVTLLAVAVTVVGAPAGAATEPYRMEPFDIQDICRQGLPWTDHKPPPLPARRPRDRDGVPMIWVNGQLHYWPGALAINGMKRIDAYLDRGNPDQLEQALKQARRLRILSLTRRQADWIAIWYDYPGQNAPWFNAMSQGLALSFYVRLYLVTGDAFHLEAARELFKGFRRLGMRRPWVAYVDGGRNLWLEHYPRRLPDHVLNAHLHAIFGIYEYWQVTRSDKARRVLRGAITTMSRNKERYRRPGGVSLYGLRSRSQIFKYHEIHIWQFRLLGKISGRAEFTRFANALTRDASPIGRTQGRPAKEGSKVVGRQCRPDLPAGS